MRNRLHRWILGLSFILVLVGAFSYFFTSKVSSLKPSREDVQETPVTEKTVSVPAEKNGTKAEKPDNNSQKKVVDAETLQKERHEHLQKFCGEKKSYDFDFFDYLIYNDKRKIIYCIVPKVACTQWKRIFMLFDGYETRNQVDIPANKVHDEYIYNDLKKLPHKEAFRRLNEYKKFVFVREPYERLISGFREKFINFSPYYSPVYGAEMIRRYRKNPDEESLKKGHGVKFHEFVNFVVDGNLEEHWLYQATLCQPCAVDYDVLGHFETLQMDAEYLLKIAGVEDIKFPEVRYTNTSSYLEEYYSKIPKEHVRRIKSMYQQDFDAFNFEVPEVIKKFLN